MYYDSCQFGSFEGRDNRRTIMELFVRMGQGVPDCIGGLRRQKALEGLIVLSGNGFAERMVTIHPCTAKEAYFYFVAITSALGVPIETATRLIEEEVRKERWGMIAAKDFSH